MVCREIISCPVVHELRGALGDRRITYCETCALPCPLRQLVRDGKPIPPAILPRALGDPRLRLTAR
jgi:hypothetical protein